MISRRFFLSAALGALGSAAQAQSGTLLPFTGPDSTPRPKMRPVTGETPGARGLEAILRAANVSGQTHFAGADAVTGSVLEDRGGASGLPPASVTKALTALYALDVLGPNHRFKTRLLATGPVTAGVLQGDLVLACGGAQTMDRDDLAQLADDLKAAGVVEVRGRFGVWDGALPYVPTIDPGQPDYLGYSPAISGLALNFNRVHFEWKRAGQGWNTTLQARTARLRPDVTMTRMKIVDRSAPVFTYLHERGVDSWSVARGALGKEGARWLPVRRPGLYAADVFRSIALGKGLRLGMPEFLDEAPQGKLVAAHSSAPLSALLKEMLKYSNNLMAEMIGLAATARIGGDMTNLVSSARQMSEWARVKYGLTNSLLVDHSGLGETSRMSAADLVMALSAAHGAAQLKPLLKQIHIKDSKGRPLYDHPVTVMAKTGTLNFVSGLGGFVTTADGRELVFAIFSADLEKRAGIARSQRDRPRGAKSWNARAKRLQLQLIERWAHLYST